MYPILATGLMAAGHRLIEGVVAPVAQKVLQSVNESFSGEGPDATAATQPVSALSQQLAAAGVQDATGLANHRFHLQQQLLQHPEVRAFVEQFEPGAGIGLTLEDGSLFTFRGPDGRSLSVPANSEVGRLAMEFHQVASLEQSLERQPGLSLMDVANQVDASPGLQAHWTLKHTVA
ncbi:MAG: hypothetical protein ACFB20_06675 [Opitutales bacterium]